MMREFCDLRINNSQVGAVAEHGVFLVPNINTFLLAGLCAHQFQRQPSLITLFLKKHCEKLIHDETEVRSFEIIQRRINDLVKTGIIPVPSRNTFYELSHPLITDVI